MIELLWQRNFWILAGLYAVLCYFYSHQCAHAQSAMTGRSTLHPALIGIMSLYNALFINWLLLAYYGYKTVWYNALDLGIFGALGALALKKAGDWLALERYAWIISLIAIPAVPLLAGLMVWLV